MRWALCIEILDDWSQNPKYGGPELVQRMLELLSQEQDSICDDWVRHMVSLLVQQSATLVATPGCRELLTYSLDLPAVAKEVPTHLEVPPPPLTAFTASSMDFPGISTRQKFFPLLHSGKIVQSISSANCALKIPILSLSLSCWSTIHVMLSPALYLTKDK